MNDHILLNVLEASDRRREERRRFIKFAGGATLAVGGMSLLAACDDNNNNSPTPTPSPSPSPSASPSPSPSPSPSSNVSDADVLNFALNLEYLEAQFYSFAAFGKPLRNGQLTGKGTQGAVVGGRKVNFTDPLVAQYAREIAIDEIAHVDFLRAALRTARVAQPAINISGGADGAFTAAARAAGVVGPTDTFDPYASDENFLLGAFIFEDVGVTAYHGAAPLLSNKTYLEAAAGILAAEAYHAGLIRTVLYAKGMDTRNAANKISDARDSLDGTSDLDEGIGNRSKANIVPADKDSIAFARTADQVLNIVYLNNAAVVGGGFFPDGVNGSINTSGANA